MRAWLILPVLVALLAGGEVWLSHVRYELSLDMQRIKAEQKAVAVESSRLRLEVANLSRPERLRQYALNTLGMVPPKPMQVIHQ